MHEQICYHVSRLSGWFIPKSTTLQQTTTSCLLRMRTFTTYRQVRRAEMWQYFKPESHKLINSFFVLNTKHVLTCRSYLRNKNQRYRCWSRKYYTQTERGVQFLKLLIFQDDGQKGTNHGQHNNVVHTNPDNTWVVQVRIDNVSCFISEKNTV